MMKVKVKKQGKKENTTPGKGKEKKRSPLSPEKNMVGSVVMLSLLSLLSGSVGVAAVEDRQVLGAASGSEVSVHVGQWEGGARLELPAGRG